MSEIAFDSINALGQKIRTKEISPVELTIQTLQRIEQIDPSINAYIKVMSEDAMQQAASLEQEVLQNNIRGPLHGIPISLKDIFETKGHETTCGSKVLEHWIPDRDATIVTKLKNAGAIIIGKTNMHEWAMGATTENPHFGTTRNPWNLNKISGGSSGGSAAAVAAGLCFGSIGTDAAGSIRLPAALCGIVGIKPTYGRVSRHGSLPGPTSFDHIGPLTRTVKDSAILLQAIAGFDKNDPSSSRRPVDIDFERPLQDLKGIKLGVCRNYFYEGLHDEVKINMEKSIVRLKDLGAEIVEINIAGIDEALNAFKIIAQSELYTFHKPIWAKVPHLYSEDFKVRFNFAKQINVTDYLNAQKLRNKFIHYFLDCMSSVSAIIAPSNSQPAFTIGSKTPEENMQNIYTIGKTPLGNFLAFPAISVPCGLLPENLPAGMQLIGKPFAEKLLLQVADCFERSYETTLWKQKLAANLD